MRKSFAGSFTSDGQNFVFNNFFSTLNQNFETTDKTGRGKYTNAQIWQLAYNEYDKATDSDLKEFYKTIASYMYGISTKKGDYAWKTDASPGAELIKNTTLAQIYAYLAQKDGLEAGWKVITDGLGAYTSQYPNSYKLFIEKINSDERENPEKTETDKSYSEQSLAEEVKVESQQKQAETTGNLTDYNSTLTETTTTATASMNWLWVLAAAGIGFALIFGTGKKKKKR